MKKAIKFLVGTVLLICIILGLGYLGLAVYYENGFSFMTYINGVYCTGKTVEAVNTELNESFQYEGITINYKEGSFYISADDIGYSYDYREPLNHYLEVQNPYLWVENLTEGQKEYTLLPAILYDEQKLNEILDSQFDKMISNEVISVNMKLTESGFVLIDNKNDILDIKKAKEAVVSALCAGDASVDLNELNCYYNEPYTDKEKELISLFEKLEAFQQKKVSYLFDEEKEVFSSLDIVKTLSFYKYYTDNFVTDITEFRTDYLDENGRLLVDEDGVSALLEEKLKAYNTYHNHTFTTHDERELLIKGGTYGNMIAMKTEKKELLAFLQSDENNYTRTPQYTKEVPIKGKNDIGDTYIEVDIGQQKMFYYRDGKLFIETDVVTGRNNATREEVCYVYAKQKNRTLRGPGYESFVYYWMPVSGGIGIHDATWRSKFGGDIYLRDGSHGCVNTPIEIVEQMYEVMEVGTPCILYYGLETEK